jgi:hypothetical protein
MGVWEWVTAVLAIWGAVSILAGVFWGLAGRRIFRKPPVPPRVVINNQRVSEQAVTDIVNEMHRRNRMSGGL